MNFNIIKNISVAAMSITLIVASGCSDFLDEMDPSNVTQDNYFTIPEHAESALAAAYARTRVWGEGAEIFSSNYQMLELPTGTARTQTTQNTHLNNLQSLDYDGNTVHVRNWWNGLYRLIAQTNLTLEKVPGIKMDETRKKQILGEARFLRAWSYFYLVRIYGAVPLITKQILSEEDPNFKPSRTPVEEVYNQIVADLIEAEAAGLKWADVTGRVSQAAVKAELAEVYLTMAGHPLNKGVEYYQLAANKAKEVIDYANAHPSEINLFANYNDIHTVANNNKLEHLFQIQYNNAVVGNPMQGNLLPQNGSAAAQSGQGSQVPTPSFYNSFEPGDKRTVNREGYFYTSYWTKGSQDPLIELGVPFIFKHFDVAANGTLGVAGSSANNLNVQNIRYAQVLLTYAEAQNEVSGPTQEAFDAYKRIRDRALLSTPDLGTFTQASFREAVWRERWYELCYEGITWFDMVRIRQVFNETTKGFDPFVGHINNNSGKPLQEKHLLFPIPSDEIRNNQTLN